MATELINPSGQPGAAPGAGEPCPTPLEWRVVLREFREQSRPFTAPNLEGPDPITGRTFGHGVPLYVLGPAAGEHALFALLAWLLKDDFCCVFVDLPNLRWPVRSAVELPKLTGAVLSTAAHLGHDRHAVLGVEFGSALALDLAANYPDRITALILLQAAAKFAPSWLERGYYAYGSFLPGAIGGMPGWWNLQQRNHRRWFPPFDDSRFDFLVETLGRSATAQVSRRMQLWSGLDFQPHLRSINAPTLLIQSEGDGPIVAEHSRALHNGLADVHTEELHSAGVYPYLTHPHRVAKLLRSFLNEVRARES